MVLAVSYALNAHQEAHRRTAGSSDGACENHSSNSSCHSAQQRAGCDSGYGKDLRSASSGTCGSAGSGTGSVAPSSMFATPQQKRLAEITEMIHTASLFHDDVIDKVSR
jgi:geranylgeranyl pyrophosphate synthase